MTISGSYGLLESLSDTTGKTMAPIVQIIERYLCLVVSAASKRLQVVGDCLYPNASSYRWEMQEYVSMVLDVDMIMFVSSVYALELM
jgi:hypothetical protein